MAKFVFSCFRVFSRCVILESSERSHCLVTYVFINSAAKANKSICSPSSKPMHLTIVISHSRLIYGVEDM